MPAASEALPGRPQPLPVAEKHFVNGNRLAPPFPAGYAGGFTPNPTYPEVCTGQTGHTEVVRVVFDPEKISYSELLKAFWESHDPTQGMRQGGDVGTQYRSAIHAIGDRQLELAGNRRPRTNARSRMQAAAVRLRPKSGLRLNSSMPRIITSSIWRKIPTATAASAAPASPVQRVFEHPRKAPVALFLTTY
jgi:methionine-S-sulfoxide reductase